MSFNIIGTGSSTPGFVVTNEDLSKILDTSDEWIATRTGIHERRVLKDESLMDLAVAATKNALDDAGIKGDEIDMIIFSTLQGDYISPSMSCLLSKEIGANCTHMFDMNMGCSGFLFALDMAIAYFDAKKVEKVLIVCAEPMSRMVDWNDRATCVLFGDGAGAVVLEKGDSLISIKLNIDGHKEHLNIPGVGGNSPFDENKNESSFLYMNGQEIFKFAVSSIISDVKNAIQSAGFTPDDISYYLLHQANMRIIESARVRLKQTEEKFPHNMEHYGNTSSASIPILLDELNKSGAFKKGDKLVLSAFGAGLTTGVCIVEW